MEPRGTLGLIIEDFVEPLPKAGLDEGHGRADVDVWPPADRDRPLAGEIVGAQAGIRPDRQKMQAPFTQTVATLGGG